MDPSESGKQSSESRILAAIQAQDARFNAAMARLEIRMARQWKRMDDIVEMVQGLDRILTEHHEKLENLESTKLDTLEERENRQRIERDAIVGQYVKDTENHIESLRQGAESTDDMLRALDACLELLAVRIAELERIARTQFR